MCCPMSAAELRVRWLRTSRSAALVLAALTSWSAARADGAGPDAEPASTDTAQALFEEARILVSAKRYEEACPKLASSFRLDPGAGTEINLADCYEKNGQVATAWATFQDAASTARRAGRVEWAARAERRAALLEPQVPALTVRVPSANAVDGLELRRNGVLVPVSSWATAIPVDPGTYRIEANAPSRRPWVYEIEITLAARVTVNVPLLDIATDPPPSRVSALRGGAEPPALRRPSSVQRTAGIVTAAAGAVGVAAGVALGTWALFANHEVESKCPSGTACRDAEAAQLSRKADTAGIASTIALISGGALVGVGAVLLFAAPGRPGSGVRSSATAIPGGGALLVQGNF
jgi:hypothetical protein